MQYEFEAGLIDEPRNDDINGLVAPGKLTSADQEWALKWYPPLAVASDAHAAGHRSRPCDIRQVTRHEETVCHPAPSASKSASGEFRESQLSSHFPDKFSPSIPHYLV